MRAAEEVRELVTPLLGDLGLELYDVLHEGGTLRVLVDHPDGVDMEQLTVATRLVSRALDEDDPVSGSYTLEVSSPGLERRLRTPEHFAGAVGEKVTVKLVPQAEGPRRIRGELTSSDEHGFEVASPEGTRHRCTFDDVDTARTVFEWGPAPKPGQGNKKGNRKQKASLS